MVELESKSRRDITLREARENGRLVLAQVVALPRSVSTAFEYALSRAVDGKQLNEPVNKVNRTTDVLKDLITAMLRDVPEGEQLRVVSKVISRPITSEQVIDVARIARGSIVNIRDPRRQVPSLLQVMATSMAGTDPTLTPDAARSAAWAYLSKDDYRRTNWGAIAEHYRALADADLPVTVVDSDDFTSYPEQVLRASCDFLGTPFVPGASSWERPAMNDFADYSGYDSATAAKNGVDSPWLGAFMRSSAISPDSRDTSQYLELPGPVVDYIDRIYEGPYQDLLAHSLTPEH